MNGVGRQRCPRFSNVAAGEKATHPRLAHHRHLADVCRCEKPDVGRTQSAAGGCETTPASGVAARALDERSRNYGLQKTASTVAFVLSLLRESDSIGTMRQPSACMHPLGAGGRQVVGRLD